MSITLADEFQTIDLHADLYWPDEFNWHPVAQTAQRSITGAHIVQAAAMLAGRPITLEPEDDSSAWMRTPIVQQLRNWAAEPGKQFVLTLRGEARDVIFRHHDGTGFEARPVVHFSDIDTSDFYRCTLRFMEI